MIETTQQLSDYFESLEGDFRAMDLEGDSLYHYHEKISLVQFTDGEKHQLIDPLAVEDMQPLKDFLKDGKLWMHGADYDIVMMRKDLDVVPPVIWDTQIGARLLGVKKFGYGNLVEHYQGVEISKSSQKADWSKRPLTEKMRDYAINDVLFLKPIVDQILAGLHEKGRYEWFVESCEWARAKVLERPMEKEDPWRIAGSGKLSPRAQAYLRALWYWRDQQAMDWDRPTFMVCGNKQLIIWVSDLMDGKSVTLPKHYRPNRVKAFYAAAEDAKNLTDDVLPKRPCAKGKRVKNDAFDARVDALIKQRDSAAIELDIDSSLIISRAMIDALAANEVEPSAVLMKWQIGIMDL
ncbi:MAG: ribonuclease D [Cryomorphaceae bacterium]|jgi:ribonuclease D